MLRFFIYLFVIHVSSFGEMSVFKCFAHFLNWIVCFCCWVWVLYSRCKSFFIRYMVCKFSLPFCALLFYFLGSVLMYKKRIWYAKELVLVPLLKKFDGIHQCSHQVQNFSLLGDFWLWFPSLLLLVCSGSPYRFIQVFFISLWFSLLVGFVFLGICPFHLGYPNFFPIWSFIVLIYNIFYFYRINNNASLSDFRNSNLLSLSLVFSVVCLKIWRRQWPPHSSSLALKSMTEEPG